MSVWIAPDWSCWVASSSAEIVVVPPTWQQKHNEVKSSKHHGLVCKSNLYSLCLHYLSIQPRSYRILDHQLCWSTHVRCGSRRCLSGSGSRLNTTIDAIVEVIRKVRIHFKNSWRCACQVQLIQYPSKSNADLHRHQQRRLWHFLRDSKNTMK